MKIRNGFVSNSSSSSFICVGFPASELKIETNPEKKVKDRISVRRIDELASKYFDEDLAYEAFRNGAEFPDFWKYACQQVFGSENESPEGYYSSDFDGTEYFIKRVGPSTGFGLVSIDLNDVIDELKAIQETYPGVHPKVFINKSE